MARRSARTGPRGAYGFRLSGLESFERLLVSAGEDWPLLAIEWVEDDSFPQAGADAVTSTVRMTEGWACIELGTSGVIEVERLPLRAAVRARSVAGGQAVVHPYLGGAASVAARWQRRESVHGGAFVAGGRAWGVLGARAAGKSSLLAWLHREGVPIVADDVLVLERSAAFAAPRSLDLRRETAEALGTGERLGMVGARERWRVELGPVAPAMPLGGWIHLEWGDRVEVVDVRGRDRLVRLAAQLTIPGVPVDADVLLGLAALPSFELRRPRDWDRLPEGSDALLDAVRSVSAALGKPDGLQER